MKVLLTQKVHGIAGCETYLLQLAPALQQAGVQVGFLLMYEKNYLPAADEFAKRLQGGGVADIVYLPVGKWPQLRVLKQIANLVSAGFYDIVHSNLLPADLLMAAAKRLFMPSMKLVSGKHGYEEAYNNQFGFDPRHRRINVYWLAAVWAERQIDRSFAISRGLFDLYTGLKICKKEQLDHIPYGFHWKDTDIHPEPSLRQGHPQLCIVGRLTAFKGHRYAFHALQKLKTRYPSIRLIVVGWGELEEALKTLADELGITHHVAFTGRQTNPRSHMASADIVLVPSVAEGFGIVLLEAMSVRKPIVAFNVPSPNEILSDGCGVLVSPFDTDQYAEAIVNLLERPEAAQTISMNAYKKMKSYYNQERMIADTILFYTKALSS